MTRKYWPKTYWPKTYWQKHIVKNILWRNILWKNILVPKHITVGCRIIRMDLGFDNNQRIKEASYTECQIIMSKIYQLWMVFCCHQKIVIKASKMSSNELSNITSQCVDYGQKCSNNLAAYCVLWLTYPGYTFHKQRDKMILEITTYQAY